MEALIAQRRAFAVKLAQIKHEAGVLGLYRTLQALDSATNAVGYEIADLETGKRGDPVAKGLSLKEMADRAADAWAPAPQIDP
jgi:hypothetical protein